MFVLIVHWFCQTGRSPASLHAAWDSRRSQPILLWALQKEMWCPQGDSDHRWWLCISVPHFSFLCSVFCLQGLRFLHFPYLLTLQLKRFDFDYTTMHRIKLNDRMTFPEELDMSPFIDVEDEVRHRLMLSFLSAHILIESIINERWSHLPSLPLLLTSQMCL